MARDYTKYNVKGVGEKLNKRQLVFEVVKNWATKKKPSLKVMTNTFSDEIQGSKGFIKKKAEVKDPKRFNMQEPLSIKNGTKVVVSNQWGTKNIADFLELAKKLGYKIEAVEAAAPKKAAAPAKSPLTEEQIAEFKERIKDDINGDYDNNSYYAYRIHDDLIEEGDIAWADTILEKIVDQYTRESGVRGLEKMISKMIRYAAKSIANYKAKAPQKSEIFSSGRAGQTISIGCWIQRSITVPNL